MEKIASFQVDHTKIGKGMYISRIDGDIVTYDIRTAVPNSGQYMENDQIHTTEHLMATYMRSSKFSGNIVYVGPMGCLTGFYILTRGLSHEDAIALTQETFAFVAGFTGEIPGCSEAECGNYGLHSLEKARALAQQISEVLAGWTAEKLVY